MCVCILTLCYPEEKKKKKKGRQSSLRILVKNVIFEGRFEPEGGEDTLVHIKFFFFFRSYALHNRRKKRKTGRPFMFWRGTRFIRLRGKSTKRQFTCSKRERDIKCKRPTRAGRNGGKNRREENGGISSVAAKNHKLTNKNPTKLPWSI